MKNIILVLLLATGVGNTFASAADSKVIETWECKSRFGYWKDILVEAEVHEGRMSGKVKAAGVEHPSVFAVNGFNRRWDFGIGKGDISKYGLIISPDGSAAYYEFNGGEEVSPSMLFDCRQKGGS